MNPYPHLSLSHVEVPMKSSDLTRRSFVRTVLGTTALGVSGVLKPLETIAASAGEIRAMPVRPLGRTGHKVRIFSLGGQATLEQEGKTDEAVAIVNRAIDLGVNYIDTSHRYGNGISETYIGTVMATRRKEVFLATKTRERSYDGSMRALEGSLKRLQTDHVDLWQLHNVRTQEDLDQVFADDGAVKALEKARDEKIVRFLGITGHRDPFVLRKGIEQYSFDSILMALNAADRHSSSFIENLLPIAVKKNMAIIGMKIPARGKLFRAGGITTMEDAMGYVLTLPVSTVIVGISTISELEENVRIATEFSPLNTTKMKRLEDLTKNYYAEASFYKTSW
jgi:aryl-alcohol dehydrogenase-like predicted oxidoreductase